MARDRPVSLLLQDARAQVADLKVKLGAMPALEAHEARLQTLVREYQAVNEAMAAALRAKHRPEHAEACDFHKGGLYVCTCGIFVRANEMADAALSDAGKGWLEVREQVRLAIGHAFHLIEHNKAMCVRCREAKQRLRAALDALGGK